MSIIGDIFGSFSTMINNERSLGYQRQLQQQLFERDDNAMQRRMADYSASGINPLLAIGGSGAGNTSAGGISLQSFTPTADILERKSRVTENNILKKKEKEQDNVNESLWLKNEEQKLKNKMLEKELDTLETLDFYPLSAPGKWVTDINRILGLTTGLDGQNFLNPLDVFNRIFPGYTLPQINVNNDKAVQTQNDIGKKINDVKVSLKPVSSAYKDSNQTNKNLAKTLDKAWIDSGFRISYHNGKFTIEDFNSRPPQRFDFDSYQQASQYLWSTVN